MKTTRLPSVPNFASLMSAIQHLLNMMLRMDVVVLTVCRGFIVVIVKQTLLARPVTTKATSVAKIPFLRMVILTRLFSTLETFFPNGKVDLVTDLQAGNGIMTVYDGDSPNDGYAIECIMSGCDFPIGGSGASCSNSVCKCSDQCNNIVSGIVETIGGPLKVLVDNGELESRMSVQIEGVGFDIEAMCTASACTAVTAVAENFTLNDAESHWSGVATFSLALILSFLGVLLLVSLCVFGPYFVRQRKHAQTVQSASNEEMEIAPSSSDNSGNDNDDENITNLKLHTLEFRHLSRTVNLQGKQAKVHGSTEKYLVNNVSGNIKSGTLCAIMGPSGAGKSSLLNILAAVEGSDSRVSGQILLNGKLQIAGYRKAVAYVQQDDSLYDTLTVHECIEYSAMLRLPKSMSASKKQELVWKTINELHLSHIAYNRIGLSGRAGISGGERKRVSIGMELVSQATVLMLDEPTSGLDSHAANSLIRVLLELASRNRIVLLSIHQPSTKCFLSMDKILLLGGGKIMYDGKPSDVESFLEARGFKRQPMESVADYMLEVVSNHDNRLLLGAPDANRDDYQELLTTGETLETAISWQDESITRSGSNNQTSSRDPPSLVQECSILFARTAKDILRNRELFSMQLGISVALAFFGGAIFNDVGNNLAGFQNRMGAFYFCLSFFAFSSFSSMETFVTSRNIFVRETGSKYYRTFSYYLSKIVLDMLFLRVVPVTIFAFSFYWIMGLKSEPEAFVIFWATLVLFNICAGTISICISIATSTVSQANLVAAVWFLIMLLFGGFLVNVDTMAPWYSWIRYLSIFYYCFEILMTNELSGLVIKFDAPGYPSIPVYGEVFLKSIGMDVENQMTDLICLCSLAFGFSLVAYLLLRLRVPPSAATLFRVMQKENKRLAKNNRAHNENDGVVDIEENFSFTTADEG